MDDSQIAAWETHTDFSHLRSLKLERGVGMEVPQRLASLAECGAFGHLRALDLPAGSSRDEYRVEIDPAMQQLLSCLRPLELLTITGVGDAPFDAALEQHGASL